MKKLTALIVSLIFFTFISVASSYQTQSQPQNQAAKSNNTKTLKKTTKKDVKKVPHQTTVKKTPTHSANTTK